MTFRIVPMDSRHLDQVAALERRCFSQPWSRAMLEETLYLDHSNLLVAEMDQEGEGGILVLGYIGLTAVLDEGYINNVASHPDYRRMGVGTALLESLCRFAQVHLSFLSLEVRVSNQNAQALYAKHGFIQEGIRLAYYQDPLEDGLIMTRRFEREKRS